MRVPFIYNDGANDDYIIQNNFQLLCSGPNLIKWNSRFQEGSLNGIKSFSCLFEIFSCHLYNSKLENLTSYTRKISFLFSHVLTLYLE